MSLEGMDVDQAQGLARRLEANAHGLTNVATALAGLTAELSHCWRGPASATFQQQWATRHRPALSNAAQALADMQTHLVANIQQQIRASAADPSLGQANGIVGGAALTALLGGVGTAWGIADWLDQKRSLVMTPLEKIREVAGNKDVTGRYHKTWTRIKNLDQNGDFLKYKKSPVLQWLHDNPHVQLADQILTKTHTAGLLEKLGPVGTAMGVAKVTVDIGQGGDELYHQQYASAGGRFVDATADGLKTIPNPVAYLAGGTVALLKEDYILGSQIDWKNIPNPLNADTFRNDYLPTFESLPGQTVGILAKAYS